MESVRRTCLTKSRQEMKMECNLVFVSKLPKGIILFSMDPLSPLLNPDAFIDFNAVDPASNSVLSLQNNDAGCTFLGQGISSMKTWAIQ